MAENGSNELNSRQARAITALMSTRNVGEAAKVAKVGERTLYRWLAEPVFRLHLTEAEGQALDAATRRLLALQGSAIETVESVMSDTTQPSSVRLRAAQTVLDYMLKLRELRDIEIRLLALEQSRSGNEFNAMAQTAVELAIEKVYSNEGD